MLCEYRLYWRISSEHVVSITADFAQNGVYDATVCNADEPPMLSRVSTRYIPLLGVGDSSTEIEP